MKTFAKIIGYGLVVLLIAATLGFTYKYTNGFNEDLKTFYVEHNGKQILTTESKLTFKKKSYSVSTSSTLSTRTTPSRKAIR